MFYQHSANMTPHTRPLTHDRLLPSDSYLFIYLFIYFLNHRPVYRQQFWLSLTNQQGKNNEEIRNIILKQLETILLSVLILIVLLNRCMVIRSHTDTNSSFHSLSSVNNSTTSTGQVIFCAFSSTCFPLSQSVFMSSAKHVDTL